MSTHQKFEHNKKTKLTYQLKTFGYAFNGIISFFKDGPKGIIHLIAATLAISLSVFLNINMFEWLAVCFAIGLVLVTEILNTALEKLVDLVNPDYNKKAGTIKDMSAAGVLVASLTAFIIGSLIFIPRLIEIIK